MPIVSKEEYREHDILIDEIGGKYVFRILSHTSDVGVDINQQNTSDSIEKALLAAKDVIDARVRRQ